MLLPTMPALMQLKVQLEDKLIAQAYNKGNRICQVTFKSNKWHSNTNIGCLQSLETLNQMLTFTLYNLILEMGK